MNQKYWEPFGASWLASLKELSNTKSSLVVIDFGLNPIIKDFLRSQNVIVIGKKNPTTNYRNETLMTVLELSQNPHV